ncbi:MAG: hypothetical protein IPK16_09100 [Anaerolineales bacterium]|nr:hypothetical protein [Anaerolineales bacterium]
MGTGGIATLRNGRAPDAPEPTEIEDGRCNMAGGDGGAIYNQGVLALQDVAVRNSRAGAGAGKSTVIDPDCSPGDGPGGRGGGVFTTRSLELTKVLFEGNASGPGGAGIGGAGGAIYNAGGTVSATASIFSHNRAMEGGSLLNVPYRYGYFGGNGGAVANGGIFAASSVSFFDNTAGAGGTDGYGSHASGANGGAGGALNNEATGTAAIFASTFAYNHAGEGGLSTWSGDGGSGGAISNYGQMEIVNSTITNNAAGNGAGGAASASNGAEGISYAGNGGSGGGIANGGTLRISATTVTENHAGKAGATRYGDPAEDGKGGGIAAESAPVVRGLILAANVATTDRDCSGTLDSRGYNLIGTVVGCTITGSTTGNITGRGAKLGPLADNGGGTLTHLPASNSPVLNAAICQTVDDQPLLYDQRWVQRPQGPRCDIGAVER